MTRSIGTIPGTLVTDLSEINPRRYWHRSFPRVSVTLWSASHGTDSVDGVCGVYVNADRDTVTLVGREEAVRFGKGTKVVTVTRSTTGGMEYDHALDTASRMVNG